MHLWTSYPRQEVDVNLPAGPAQVLTTNLAHMSPLQVQAVASYQDRFVYVLAATFERTRSTMEVWRLDLTSRLWEVVDTRGGQQCGHAVLQT